MQTSESGVVKVCNIPKVGVRHDFHSVFFSFVLLHAGTSDNFVPRGELAIEPPAVPNQ